MPSHPITASLIVAGLIMAAAFVVLLPLELVWHHRRGTLSRSRVREMLASVSPAIPVLLLDGVALAFLASLFGIAARLSPWQVPVTWWSAVLAIALVDLLYYWDHRAGHAVRLLWAVSHSVHHSSPQYDQTTGLRVSFVDGFIAPWFYLPAVLIGFDPWLVAGALLVVVGYQQWLHTELVGRLRWFDGWLSTPANHRVHHGAQPRYLDRNYGGLLIVWDRLFGTYQAEDEPARFGLTRPIESSHPWTVHTLEWTRLWRDLRATPRWRDRLHRLIRGPAWQPRRVSSVSAPGRARHARAGDRLQPAVRPRRARGRRRP